MLSTPTYSASHLEPLNLRSLLFQRLHPSVRHYAPFFSMLCVWCVCPTLVTDVKHQQIYTFPCGFREADEALSMAPYTKSSRGFGLFIYRFASVLLWRWTVGTGTKKLCGRSNYELHKKTSNRSWCNWSLKSAYPPGGIKCRAWEQIKLPFQFWYLKAPIGDNLMSN